MYYNNKGVVTLYTTKSLEILKKYPDRNVL